jgi:hypothetical protein
MTDEPVNKKIDILTKFAALIMTAVGIISGVNTYQISQLDSKISATESKNKWDFKVYDSVIGVVNSKDEGKILAVKVMVEHVASDELKNDLIKIVNNELEKIFETQDSRIKMAAGQVTATKAFKPEEEAVASPVEPSEALPAKVNWGSWDIDIFWCEASGAAAKEQADQLKYVIENDGAKGRIRSRILPEVTNKRPGYGVKGYQIRPNANELAFANEVNQFVDTLTNGDVSFEIKQSSQNTPWYLSLFICPVINS